MSDLHDTVWGSGTTEEQEKEYFEKGRQPPIGEEHGRGYFEGSPTIPLDKKQEKELREWAEEIDRRSDAITRMQDGLVRSVEFQTLANAYESMPPEMKWKALKQMADFAVLFVVRLEVQDGK